MRTSNLYVVQSAQERVVAPNTRRVDFEEAAFDAAMQQDALRESSANVHCAPLPHPPIQIQTLGGFALTIGGLPIKFGRKVQKKPLELLKAVVACGGTEVRCDMLAEALWPDADGDLAARALATALYRLRKLLGPHCLLRNNGMLTIDQRMCGVDVWRLDRLLGEIAGRCRDGDSSNAAAHIEQMLAGSNGAFLPHDNELPWVLSARERLRSKLLRALTLAGDCMTRASRYELAIACYERGIDVEPLNESMYCGLMTVQIARQHFSEAVITFDRCRRALRNELALSPSPRIQALYRRVREKSESASEPAYSATQSRPNRVVSDCSQSVSNP